MIDQMDACIENIMETVYKTCKQMITKKKADKLRSEIRESVSDLLEVMNAKFTDPSKER